MKEVIIFFLILGAVGCVVISSVAPKINHIINQQKNILKYEKNNI
tara:strand:+ start:700 stop:834 length:135 start_codon:yes stop_codon:yes gene_type:complete